MTEFDLHTKVDLENGNPAFAKPVLYAGTVDLAECSIEIQNLFLFFFEGGKFKKT
jgi:hypothetical protein